MLEYCNISTDDFVFIYIHSHNLNSISIQTRVISNITENRISKYRI